MNDLRGAFFGGWNVSGDFCPMQYSLKKNLGQHFLHDENVCEKIVHQLKPYSGMQLLEIGPGGGALTKWLLQWQDVDYKAVEVDEEKVLYLLHHYPELKEKIIQDDILKTSLPFEGKFHIIGNFPYNISSPILFKVLEWEPFVASVTGMFQKEVAQRIAAGPGSKTYGILSVLMQAFFEVEYLFDVNEGCFTPPPKVKSGVLKFLHSGNPFKIENKKRFITLVKAGFNQRRKTLRNALKSTLPPGAEFPYMDKRAEQLSVSDFVEIYRLFL